MTADDKEIIAHRISYCRMSTARNQHVKLCMNALLHRNLTQHH
jgi:hypothetical protein